MGMLILKRKSSGLSDRNPAKLFLGEQIIKFMMNQPNQHSYRSLPTVIPSLTMEKRESPNTMPHSIGIEDTVSEILQLVLNGQDSDRILFKLSAKIGNLLVSDACLVVSAVENKPNRIDFWQKEGYVWQNQHQIMNRLANLSLTTSVVGQLENIWQEVFPSMTLLTVATQYQQQTNGLIFLLKSNPSGWTNSQKELLTHISDAMAIAISQTQLKQFANNKTKYHSLIKDISREISHSSHPNLMFENCLTQIGTTLKLDRAAILMLKYQNPLQAKKRKSKKSIKGTVEIACQWSPTENLLDVRESKFFKFAHSDLCQQAWQNAPQYLFFESDTLFPDLDPQELPDFFQPNGSALLIVPLMGKKTSENSPAVVWGFLALQHYTPYHWTTDELDLVDWASIQISTAIVHHQTLDRVQSIVDERTAQLKWSLDVQAKLSEKMRQHIEQLQKLNQLKDDFMNSMSHELKTPLTSMKMAIMMLRRAEISPEMREKYLNILEQEWNREYGLIKDLLTLQELESGDLAYSPQELNLAHTIDSLAKTFRDKWSTDKGLNLEINIAKSDLTIDTDAESLTNILNELLLNAGKYSEVDTTIEIDVRQEITRKGKEIVIAIANYGAGITPEELPHIFDKFRRGQGVTDRAVPGTGLGLALVNYLVEHLNGNIEVSSEPSKSDSDVFVTTFVLKLPQFQPAIS